MQYTLHYNLNLPEGTDIVNPLIQDNPNYSAIDTALYNNKLRVVGTATHTKTGTNHSIVLADSDIPVFRFVATGDYATGDTFSVDGVTVTARVADGSTIPSGAFKINNTVLAVLDGTILNLINITGTISPDDIILSNNESVQAAITRLDSHNGHIIANGRTSVTVDDMTNYKQITLAVYLGSQYRLFNPVTIPLQMFRGGNSIVNSYNSGATTYEVEIQRNSDTSITITWSNNWLGWGAYIELS